MALFRSPCSPLPPTLRLAHLLNTSRSKLSLRSPIAMASSSASEHNDSMHASVKLFHVPALNANEMGQIAEKTMDRYSLCNDAKRKGRGTVIVWFRNDLRVLDNEVLFRAWCSSELVLPVYCLDPRHFATTHYFGFPKTGALRAQFLIECLEDLKRNLVNRGLDLLIHRGKPEEILPSIAKTFGAHTVFAQKETCSEELGVERRVREGLQLDALSSVSTSNELSGADPSIDAKPQHASGISSKKGPQLHLIWGSTMYHIDDLPFSTAHLPDVYTQFRKSVESKCRIRDCIKVPKYLGPAPSTNDWGCVPTLKQLGISVDQVQLGMKFSGGENAALSRVHEYFWKKDLLSTYKKTRNVMVGADYSTKLSPWLASGCLSPRLICEEVKRYEKERVANDSTYWVLFELIWRDYFRFLSIKYGNSIFHLGGPRKVKSNWSQDKKRFDCWKDGRTGYPLIDANMKELSTTGFMSNRGRQIVCSFLVRDMGLDWRMGAEWFETCLLDYDPCSNYGNWTYGAGVGNDPREDRYFSIPKQAKTYDPEGEYVAFWLPQLHVLPKDKRHFPGRSYIQQIVPLKFGNMPRQDGTQIISSGRQRKSRR
ncbi:cryptochrome DASH, chloroplastic/mitochondrial isoform X1 [Syzygium oleosum]|uniref:cryptochrome DASH, chloroplastic/mitochondrial isoform X1 n=2 Tax=Syzygium oleosum TaxID=219896 RepID=UPI0011D19C78|nr:cryptochrome DASH, chloroplastic/mitochondrial isoform X1 [Syzygium oleosum]